MFDRLKTLFVVLMRIFRIRFDKSPINSVETLTEFLQTRSAYVAQTSLYGYLKTRMGRNYVSIFKDERFAPSLNRAKWIVYSACLSDLTVYAIARTAQSKPAGEAEKLAVHCHRSCVQQTFVGEVAEDLAPVSLDEFASRSERMLWANAGIAAQVFTKSPAALADSSPVSEEFKELDREIVMNSVRFRWNDVRDQLNRRLDGEAVWQDWQRIEAD
ncbi:MAG: hypothetical protein OXF74_13680 [Rhodobacteraceae bacterium]|nr:hypothetical protein [Paracoccaceae bacterium]